MILSLAILAARVCSRLADCEYLESLSSDLHNQICTQDEMMIILKLESGRNIQVKIGDLVRTDECLKCEGAIKETDHFLVASIYVDPKLEVTISFGLVAVRMGPTLSETDAKICYAYQKQPAHRVVEVLQRTEFRETFGLALGCQLIDRKMNKVTIVRLVSGGISIKSQDCRGGGWVPWHLVHSCYFVAQLGITEFSESAPEHILSLSISKDTQFRLGPGYVEFEATAQFGGLVAVACCFSRYAVEAFVIDGVAYTNATAFPFYHIGDLLMTCTTPLDSMTLSEEQLDKYLTLVKDDPFCKQVALALENWVEVCKTRTSVVVK